MMTMKILETLETCSCIDNKHEKIPFLLLSLSLVEKMELEMEIDKKSIPIAERLLKTYPANADWVEFKNGTLYIVPAIHESKLKLIEAARFELRKYATEHEEPNDFRIISSFGKIDLQDNEESVYIVTTFNPCIFVVLINQPLSNDDDASFNTICAIRKTDASQLVVKCSSKDSESWMY